MSQTSDPAGRPTATGAVFRVSKIAYGVVLFLAVGVTPVALYGGPGESSEARVSALTLVYLIPILAAIYIARTSTRLDASGFKVSAIFGSRRIDWADVRGLSVTKRDVYAVLDDGTVRLPCVHQKDISVIAALSGGRIPLLPSPVVKVAPGRRG